MRASPIEIDSRNLLRVSAAVLVALGAALWVERSGAAAGAFASFLILGIPAGVLSWLAFEGVDNGRSVSPWRAVDVTVATILWTLALRQLANWFGEPGDASNGINIFWTFAIAAGFAAYSARRLGVRFLILAACLLSTVAVAGFLDAVLDGGIEPNFGAFRALIFIYALLLAGVGLNIWKSASRRGPSVGSALGERSGRAERSLEDASEVFTAAALAAVVACGYGLTSALGLIPTIAQVGTASSNLLWEILLLGVGIGAVFAGSAIGSRGLSWVGGIGLAIFFWVIGADVHSAVRRPDAFGVWPGVLLGVGFVFLVASLVPQSRIRSISRARKPRKRSDGG